MTHRFWRRLVLGVLVAAFATLGLATGSASALSMDTSTDTAISIAEDHHTFMSAQRPITYGDYQYTAYWDNEDPIDGQIYLKLTRRNVRTGNQVDIRFATEPYIYYLSGGWADGHNYVGLGISPNDGTIHIVWSLHTSDRRMRRLYSNTSCMGRTQEEFTAANCDFRFAEEMTSETRAEERITYPMFINDQRDGLWFTQRYDSSSRGNQYLYRYDEAAHRWAMVGNILRGRTDGSRDNTWEFTLDGESYAPVERSPHISQLAFDKNNRIHLAWSWREHAIGIGGQHGMNYAYSDDGVRWYSSAGTQIGTSGGSVESARNADEIISIDDLAQTQVVPVVPGHYSLTPYIAVDAYNQPHIVATESDVVTEDRSAINTRLAHYWRDTEGTWYSAWVDRTEEGTPLLLQPSLFLDRQNNVYILSYKNPLGWEPWNAEAGAYVYNLLPLENVTWQPDGERDGFLDIKLYSELTCIQANGIANVAIDPSGNNQIRFNMKNATAETDVIASWTTQESTGYSVERQQRFTSKLTREDTAYREYRLEMTHEQWRGTLRELELCTAKNVSTGSQSIDWIKITNSGGTAAKTWEFTRGVTLYGYEAALNDNWARWERQELLGGEDVVLSDSYWAIDRQRYARDKVVNFHAMIQGVPGIEELSMREFDILGDDAAMDVRFDTDKNGWSAQRDVSSFRWSNDGGNKGVTGTLTGIDSQIVSPTNLKLPVGETTGDWVHVRMKNSTEATRAKLYFITDADRTWNETKAVEFRIGARTGYEYYDIDMSRVSGWRNNTIYQLRLDPANDGRARSFTFNLDRIWIADS